MRTARKEGTVLSLVEAVMRINTVCSLHISDSTLGELLLQICPSHAKMTKWRIFPEAVLFVASYWNEWGNRQVNGGRPTIIEWAKKHSLAIPRVEPVPPPTIASLPPALQSASASAPGDDRKLAKLIEKAVADALDERLEKIEKSIAPRLLEAPAKGRDNDPRIFAIEKKVNAFVFAEPVAIQRVWNHLRARFEERNGVKVNLNGSQTFPQWLRSEDWVDTFANEYQGFLDELHDQLAASGQGKLAL